MSLPENKLTIQTTFTYELPVGTIQLTNQDISAEHSSALISNLRDEDADQIMGRRWNVNPVWNLEAVTTCLTESYKQNYGIVVVDQKPMDALNRNNNFTGQSNGRDTIVVTQNLRRYLAACKNDAKVRTGHFRNGNVANYNPMNLVKDVFEVFGTDLKLSTLLQIDGEAIPNFPNILIADDYCDPNRILRHFHSTPQNPTVFIDVQANENSPFAAALHIPADKLYVSGQGLRITPLEEGSFFYDAYRADRYEVRNFIDSTKTDDVSNLPESEKEITDSIYMLLLNHPNAQNIVVKCVEGKDRSPTFAFLYTVAWLYQHHGIKLNPTQFDQLKFAIEIQNGPISNLEFLDKLCDLHHDTDKFLEHYYGQLAPLRQAQTTSTAGAIPSTNKTWVTFPIHRTPSTASATPSATPAAVTASAAAAPLTEVTIYYCYYVPATTAVAPQSFIELDLTQSDSQLILRLKTALASQGLERLMSPPGSKYLRIWCNEKTEHSIAQVIGIISSVLNSEPKVPFQFRADIISELQKGSQVALGTNDLSRCDEVIESRIKTGIDANKGSEFKNIAATVNAIQGDNATFKLADGQPLPEKPEQAASPQQQAAAAPDNTVKEPAAAVPITQPATVNNSNNPTDVTIQGVPSQQPAAATSTGAAAATKTISGNASAAAAASKMEASEHQENQGLKPSAVQSTTPPPQPVVLQHQEPPIFQDIRQAIQRLEQELLKKTVMNRARKTTKLNGLKQLEIDLHGEQPSSYAGIVNRIEWNYPGIGKGVFSKRTRQLLEKVKNLDPTNVPTSRGHRRK